MNYTSASEKLTGRNSTRRKLGNNTYLERRDAESIAVRLHATDVVTFHANGDTVLNSGGWRTPTTKERINTYAPVSISQERGIWYVNRETVFADGMMIHKDGSITGGKPVAAAKQLLTLRRKVRAFAADYASAFLAGDVPEPGAGDCFFCGMRTTDTHKPLGEVAHDEDHLRSHMEERYFVPSLLWNALEFLGASIAMKQTVQAVWAGKPEFMFFKKDNAYFRAEIVKYVSRYMLKQLGQAA